MKHEEVLKAYAVSEEVLKDLPGPMGPDDLKKWFKEHYSAVNTMIEEFCGRHMDEDTFFKEASTLGKLIKDQKTLLDLGMFQNPFSFSKIICSCSFRGQPYEDKKGNRFQPRIQLKRWEEGFEIVAEVFVLKDDGEVGKSKKARSIF